MQLRLDHFPRRGVDRALSRRNRNVRRLRIVGSGRVGGAFRRNDAHRHGAGRRARAAARNADLSVHRPRRDRAVRDVHRVGPGGRVGRAAAAAAVPHAWRDGRRIDAAVGVAVGAGRIQPVELPADRRSPGGIRRGTDRVAPRTPAGRRRTGRAAAESRGGPPVARLLVAADDLDRGAGRHEAVHRPIPVNSPGVSDSRGGDGRPDPDRRGRLVPDCGGDDLRAADVPLPRRRRAADAGCRTDLRAACRRHWFHAVANDRRAEFGDSRPVRHRRQTLLVCRRHTKRRTECTAESPANPSSPSTPTRNA
jgi:hypothetical protein